MRYFDYQKVAEEAGIPARSLAEISHLVREEFPKDDMLYELHLLRTCLAIQDGHITLAEALAAEATKRA